MSSINWSSSNMWVSIAQLVEPCSVNTQAMGSSPVEVLKKKFRAKIGNGLNYDYSCDDRILISSVFPKFKLTSFHVLFLSRVKMNS